MTLRRVDAVTLSGGTGGHQLMAARFASKSVSPRAGGFLGRGVLLADNF